MRGHVAEAAAHIYIASSMSMAENEEEGREERTVSARCESSAVCSWSMPLRREFLLLSFGLKIGQGMLSREKDVDLSLGIL